MNYYRELAENVWNPKFNTGADIQRQLDLMDQFQSSPPTSNIGYATNTPQPEYQNYQNYQGGGDQSGESDLTGQLADDPFGWAIMGYPALGTSLTKGIFGQKGLQAAQQAFPSPTTPLGKAVTGTAPMAASYFLGIPNFFANMAMRGFVNPLTAFIEGLLGYGKTPDFSSSMPNLSFNMATQQFDVDRSINPISDRATFTGIDTSDVFGLFSQESMSTPAGQAAALSALGSTAALGSSEAAMVGFSSGLGIGAFSGGTSFGGGEGEGEGFGGEGEGFGGGFGFGGFD